MFNVAHLIQTGGLALIALIIFGESGMFIGFFFPGDTLLLSAGVFAAQGKLELVSIMVVVALAAIAGDNVGYQIGRRYGRKLFEKEDGIIFKKQYLTDAEKFYAKYGSKAMLIAHFVPVVRTFAPSVAGAAEMKLHQFVVYDAIGDTAWAIIVTLVGYYFGSKVPNLDHYILLAVGAVMLITLASPLYQVFKHYRRKHRSKPPLKD